MRLEVIVWVESGVDGTRGGGKVDDRASGDNSGALERRFSEERVGENEGAGRADVDVLIEEGAAR